jgi:hypothetical protein
MAALVIEPESFFMRKGFGSYAEYVTVGRMRRAPNSGGVSDARHDKGAALRSGCVRAALQRLEYTAAF